MKTWMLAALCLGAWACKEDKSRTTARAKLEEAPSDLRYVPGGPAMVYLSEAVLPRREGISPKFRLGRLRAQPVGGGNAQVLGQSVPNVPGGFLLSPNGEWLAYLSNYLMAEQSGDLFLQDLKELGKEPARLAPAVATFRFRDDSSQILYIENGSLHVGPLGGPHPAVAGDVAMADFVDPGRWLLFRKKSAAGAGLYAVAVDGEAQAPRRLAEAVGEFVVSPNGQWVAYSVREQAQDATYALAIADLEKGQSRRVGKNVIEFQFAADSQRLVWNEAAPPRNAREGVTRENPGELKWLAVGSGKAQVLGDKVHDFVLSADGQTVAFRKEIRAVRDYPNGEGELWVHRFGPVAPTAVRKKVLRYILSPQGDTVAFSYRVIEPLVSIDLGAARVADPKPNTLQTWVYEFEFSPDGRFLYTRSNCVAEGRICDLLRWDSSDWESKVKRLAADTLGFRLHPDGKKALLTVSQGTLDEVEVRVVELEKGNWVSVAKNVRPPLYWGDAEGTSLALLTRQGAARTRIPPFQAPSVTK